MKKVFNYFLAYVLWFFDIGLALLLFFRLRDLIWGLFILLGDPTNLAYINRINVIDRFLVVILGIVWLIYMIVVEEYFRTGVPEELLLKRFARVTAPVLLILFVNDLLLVIVQGVSKAGWLQWLALVVELGAGIGLLAYNKTQLPSKSLPENSR
jgi:hypothetical protein